MDDRRREDPVLDQHSFDKVYENVYWNEGVACTWGEKGDVSAGEVGEEGITTRRRARERGSMGGGGNRSVEERARSRDDRGVRRLRWCRGEHRLTQP